MCTKCLREWIAATRAAVAQTDTGNLIDLDDVAALTERLEHCTHGATPPRPSVLPPREGSPLPENRYMELGRIAFEAYNTAKGGKTFDGRPIPPWSEVMEKSPDVCDAWMAAASAVRAALKGNP